MSYTKEDYLLELKLLQQKDTENAKKIGFDTKKKWFDYITKQEVDEIAEAVISLAERFELPVDVVARHFDVSDESMFMRVGKIITNKHNNVVDLENYKQKGQKKAA